MFLHIFMGRFAQTRSLAEGKLNPYLEGVLHKQEVSKS